MDFIDQIPLSQKKLNDIRSYNTFGEKWILQAIRSAKASIYIEHNLLAVKDDGGVIGNCCSAGTIVYVRKDGGNIMDDDITALLLINRGQENGVRKRTDKEVTIYWLCDSSD